MLMTQNIDKGVITPVTGIYGREIKLSARDRDRVSPPTNYNLNLSLIYSLT